MGYSSWREESSKQPWQPGLPSHYRQKKMRMYVCCECGVYRVTYLAMSQDIIRTLLKSWQSLTQVFSNNAMQSH